MDSDAQESEGRLGQVPLDQILEGKLNKEPGFYMPKPEDPRKNKNGWGGKLESKATKNRKEKEREKQRQESLTRHEEEMRELHERLRLLYEDKFRTGKRIPHVRREPVSVEQQLSEKEVNS